METITLQTPLFPASPDFRVFRGFESNKCPRCGEQRTTNSIYGTVSFLCGFSRRPIGVFYKTPEAIQLTVCQGDRYKCYVEEEACCASM